MFKLSLLIICIGNYTVREVLMKNRMSFWRNVYNTHEWYYKYFANTSEVFH